MLNLHDLRPTIVPKSDQLNAEQLIGGPMTIRVTDVAVTSSAEQPVTIHYDGEDGRPFKPCKTMRKVLILAWGQDGSAWAGKSMTLFNDPSVKFGGQTVGGIRISHLSDIDRDIAVSLTATKGKKAQHIIKALRQPAAKNDQSPQAVAARITQGVQDGDAESAALAMSGWDQERIDAIWPLLSSDVADALNAAWPKQETA